MSPEVDFSLKRSSATFTSERFETGMFTAVRYEVGRLGKGFTAFSTFVRLFSCYIERKRLECKNRNKSNLLKSHKKADVAARKVVGNLRCFQPTVANGRPRAVYTNWRAH